MERSKIWEINKSHLAEGLAMLRASRNMTLEEVADESGTAITYLSKVENGALVPKMITLSAILAVYDMTIEQFYYWRRVTQSR